MAYLEDVFRRSGMPTHTFVAPMRYDEIMVSLRTKGRCLVMEGPSGIGKSTTINKAIAELGLESVLTLSARSREDIEMIEILPDMKDIGTVIVDDFHRLPDPVKERLSDYMKILADSETEKSKLVLIGINKAGYQLIKYANDLGLRIDVFRLEANPFDKIRELITLGEEALNIVIEQKDIVADRAQGSFQLAQLLCHKLCTMSKILETASTETNIALPIEVVIEDVMDDLGRQFKEAALMFARGSRLRPEGRAPYLRILRWLAESEEWSLDLTEELKKHKEHRGSVGQVIEKGWLSALLNDAEKETVLKTHFHFEPSTSVLSVEDPKLVFYLKNIVWRAFTRQVGYRSDVFEHRYDFALSFAGPDREFAGQLHDILSRREVATFYDLNEQHRIIAQNVEEYLAPIYKSEARYVVPLLSPAYPTRIWTKFESDHFKERFGSNSVIPIRFHTAAPGWFSDEQKYGGLGFDPTKDAESQLHSIAEILCKRLIEDRADGVVEAPAPNETGDLFEER